MGMLGAMLGQEMTERESASFFYDIQAELTKILKRWVRDNEGGLPALSRMNWQAVLDMLEGSTVHGKSLGRKFRRLYARYERAGAREDVADIQRALKNAWDEAKDDVRRADVIVQYSRYPEDADEALDGLKGSAFGNLSGSADEHRAKFHRFYQTLMQELRTKGGKVKARSIGHMGVLLGRLRAHFEELPKDVQEAELPNRDMAVTAYRAFIQRQER